MAQACPRLPATDRMTTGLRGCGRALEGLPGLPGRGWFCSFSAPRHDAASWGDQKANRFTLRIAGMSCAVSCDTNHLTAPSRSMHAGDDMTSRCVTETLTRRES